MDLQLNWGGPGYPAYDGCMKVSGQEKAAEASTASEAQMLQGWMGTQFQEQQNLLNKVLIPQLTQMVTNPQGFGAQALAAMRSQTIGTIGTQLSSEEKNMAQQFATQNMAGLGSGVQMAETYGLQQQAAGQEATGLQNIAIANAQAQQQQRQFGLQGLANASQLLGQAPQSAGLAVQASGTQFNEAYKMAQQGGLMQNILGGLAGAGIGFLTGGPAGAALGGLKGVMGGGGGSATDNTSVLSGGGGGFQPWAGLPTWLGGQGWGSQNTPTINVPLGGGQGGDTGV